MRFAFLILVLTLVFSSCEKTDLIADKPLTTSSLDVGDSERAPGGISMKCIGECDTAPGLEPSKCQIGGSTTEPVASCSCSGCKMRITFNDQDITDDKETRGLLKNNARFITTSMARLEEKYDSHSIGILEIELEQKNSVSVLTYTFTVDEQAPSTIMYVNRSMESVEKASTDAGKTYEIDCTGTCGCKEEYNFETNKASCSCDECKMQVTEVDSVEKD